MLRYPGRRHPDAKVFRILDQRLSETGSLKPVALAVGGLSHTVRTLVDGYP